MRQIKQDGWVAKQDQVEDKFKLDLSTSRDSSDGSSRDNSENSKETTSTSKVEKPTELTPFLQ